MSIYLKNGTLIDWKKGTLRANDILEVQKGMAPLPVHKIPENAGNVIDCSGRYITRAFGCGHHHIYSALGRGMGAPPRAPRNFTEILELVWWRMDKSLDAQAIRSSALVIALDCIRNGVTFVIDHHASPHAVKGSLGIIAEALEEAGLGHLLCYELSDRDGETSRDDALAETDAYLNTRKGLVGLHASFTVGNKLLEEAVKLAGKHHTGVHIHVAEDGADQRDCEEKYGKRVVKRLADAGALESSKTILGHCLHLSEEEKRIVNQSPAWVVQNTESNQNNAVGMFSGGFDRVMLGTDGMHSDMLRSAKSAYFAGQSSEGISMSDGYGRLRNVHNYLQQNFAEVNDSGSIVILDYDAPTPLTDQNFLGHLFFGIENRHIRTVISDGRLVMENGRILTIDEKTVLEQARIDALRVWENMRKY